MTDILLQAINNPIWAGPVLLTPITLDALLVGTSNLSDTYARVAVDYRQLAINNNPAPNAFEDGPPPPAGIHLQWTLPAALRHATQTDPASSDVTFPLVPDRWMITRFYRQKPDATPQVAAWVLQSDFIGSKTEGTKAYPDAANPKTVVFIGKKFDLSAWKGAPAPAVPFLRAPGPGELTWSAIYGNVPNVFSFYDPVTLPAGSIAYAVWGWYARPQDDPLFGPGGGFTTEDEWNAIMASLQWGVGGIDDNALRVAEAKEAFQTWLQANPVTGGPPATQAQQTLASQTVCHGLLFNVGWQGTDVAYLPPKIIREGKPPTVAVGSNAPEAVSAWMGGLVSKDDPLEAERLLLAFQLNRVFDYVSDPVGFDIAAENARFAVSNAGQSWIVTLPQTADTTGRGGVQQIALSPAQTAKLTELNATQLDIDTLVRTVASRQWELFSAGWKLERVRADPALQAQIQAYIARLSDPAVDDSIPAGLARLASMTVQRDRQRDALAALLGTGYDLTRTDDPQFAQPADPVVLLAGAAVDTKLDQPAYRDQTLFTRFTGQTLGGLLVDFTGVATVPPVTLGATDILGPLTLPAGIAIPKETTDLWLEAMLLNVGNARWFARIAFTKAGIASPTAKQLGDLTTNISKQQTLIWNPKAVDIDKETLAAAAGFQPLFPGLPVHVPLETAVSPWAQPWTPIYLDWEITWAPTSTDLSRLLSQWKLGDLGYEFTGTSIGAPTGKVQVRTILSSFYPKGLSEQLDAFLDSTPDLERLPDFQVTQLRETAQILGKLDVLTQSLTGFNRIMLMQAIQASMMPARVDPALLGGVLTWVPMPILNETPGFFPVRAGHFQITKLRVVDAFGQILNGTIGAGPIAPIRSQSLIDGATGQTWMEVVPRVSQPSRLDLHLVDAQDDSIVSNSSDATSPICGWVLPNHLNESLMVFDASGRNLGEVLKIQLDGTTGLRWDAAPGSEAPLGGPPQISPVDSAHLLAFVQGLLNASLITGADVLDELLDLIDVTMWATDPLGPPPTGNLAVLIGRPIALARALITMKLDGMPAFNQAFDQTGKANTGGFPSAVKFPTRIGDFQLARNGALGYFQDDDYSKCYAMYAYDRSMGKVRRTAFARRSRDVGAELRELASSAPVPAAGGATEHYVVTDHTFDLQPDSTTTVALTVLVDPRGSIPAVSGTVPIASATLPNGPVDSALATMAVTFRMGPLLIDPAEIRVPLPGDTRGRWSWIERTGVTFWREEGPLGRMQPEGAIPRVAMTLREGWLKLSGALGEEGTNA